MLYTASQLQELINNHIASTPASDATHCPAPGLYEPMTYILSSGGKRLRPILALMAYNLFKDDPQTVLSVATGLETYHNYTLMHDDLMDNAPMRRGRATVHRKWDANTAILSGDAMLVRAYQLIASCPAPKLPRIIDLFSRTALEVGEGQQLDMEFERRADVRADEYIEMIRLKTSVLLACSLSVGAILADAPSRTQTLLYRFGECLGLAFQLQDDYLDVYGDPQIFGKAIGGDIVSNKKTFLLISALERTATCSDGSEHCSDGFEIRRSFSDSAATPAEKIRTVTDIYNRLGIPDLTLQMIDRYFNEALSLLDKTDVAESRKTELRRYALSLLHRQR